MTLEFKDRKTQQIVQVTTIYDTETNKVEIISIYPVEEPVYTTLPVVETGVTETKEKPKPERPSCWVPPTKEIPQVLIPEVIKTDKPLKDVV